MNNKIATVNHKASGAIKKVGQNVKRFLTLFSIAAMNPTVFAADASNIQVNDTLKNMISVLFNIMVFGGVISLAYGVVELFKAFTSGDSDPRAMSKGVGFVIGGIAMIAIRSIVKVLLGGTDATEIDYVQ